VALTEGQVLPVRGLVQVGTRREGAPILFPASFHGDGMSFPTRGFKFAGLEVFKGLRDAGFDPPRGEAVRETLH